MNKEVEEIGRAYIAGSRAILNSAKRLIAIYPDLSASEIVEYCEDIIASSEREVLGGEK